MFVDSNEIDSNSGDEINFGLSVMYSFTLRLLY